MEINSYSCGTVIFHQGDAGDCMYSIESGTVGIYHDYGGPNEKRIAILSVSDFFGEMGLLDHAPRSATAVALEDDTILTTVSESGFYEFFNKNPFAILSLMQQMCFRLRNTTQDYIEVCRTISEAAKAEKAGQPKNGALLDRIGKICDMYRNLSYFPHIGGGF